jgi:lysophospholipase L1-like esterase
MPLGDSITQADAQHDSYRRPLWQMLTAAGYSVDFVGSQNQNHGGGPPRQDFDRDHEGHWGWRADEILESLPEWAQATRPNVVLIHLGSNDVFQNQSQESTLSDLTAIIDEFRRVNPRVQILLAQIIPVANARQNERIRRLNPEIAALAARMSRDGSPVLAVDQFTGFDVETDTYDGVHPDLSGEVKMAQRFLSAFEKLAPPR